MAASGVQGMSVREAQVFAFVGGYADLFGAAMAAVVPEQPAFPIEDRIRLICRIVVPAVWGGADDGVCGVALPFGYAVAGAGEADLSVIDVAKADVEHVVPV